jgi:hypothetical protein
LSKRGFQLRLMYMGVVCISQQHAGFQLRINDMAGYFRYFATFFL